MRGAWVGVLAVALVATALVLRIGYVNDTPGYVLRHDAVDYDVHARSIAQGEGFSKTLAHGRPTAFRPPGYPYFLGAVYHVFKADRKPVKERVHVARIAQAFVGAALVALVGVIAAQLWGSIAGLVALGLARHLPALDPRRRGGDVRAAVRRLHARLAGGRAGLPALAQALRAGRLRPESWAASPRSRAPRPSSCSSRWRSPCGTGDRGARGGRSPRPSCWSWPRC